MCQPIVDKSPLHSLTREPGLGPPMMSLNACSQLFIVNVEMARAARILDRSTKLTATRTVSVSKS